MIIDTKAPEGNAFMIMATVKSVLIQIGRGGLVKETMAQMKSGDYKNLCEVATEATCGIVTFE